MTTRYKVWEIKDGKLDRLLLRTGSNERSVYDLDEGFGDDIGALVLRAWRLRGLIPALHPVLVKNFDTGAWYRVSADGEIKVEKIEPPAKTA